MILKDVTEGQGSFLLRDLSSVGPQGFYLQIGTQNKGSCMRCFKARTDCGMIYIWLYSLVKNSVTSHIYLKEHSPAL